MTTTVARETSGIDSATPEFRVGLECAREPTVRSGRDIRKSYGQPRDARMAE